MASPEMFLSSPSRANRRIATSPLVISSSPDLPSIQQLGSQPPKPPAFKSPTPATPTRSLARPCFTTAADRLRETVNLSSSPEPAVHEAHYRTTHKDAPRGHPEMARSALKQDAVPPSVSKTVAAQDIMPKPSDVPATDSAYFNKTNTGSSKPQIKESAGATGIRDDCLNIERAPARRIDWTPPKQKVPIVIDSDNSNMTAVQPDDEELAGSGSFTKVLEAFKCNDATHTETESRPDDDGSVLRKRKLIDAVSTRPGKTPDDVGQPVATTKKKAATKKKPRTITGLATAAYKLATQPEPEPESNQTVVGGSTATGELEKPKAAKPRKRAPRKPKKAVPPKPILLSPSAALRQVADQDFLFGTSSQLAQDHSPRFLGDLATAMKNSNEIDYAPLSTPINSDAIEPPEARRSLWDAAARDEDGDLFDLGVQELARRSQTLPPPVKEADPFGYVKEAGAAADDPFLNISDALQPPSTCDNEATTVTGFSSPPLVPTEVRSLPCSQDTGPTPRATEVTEVPESTPRPSFDLYTDAQLAKAVSSYGFKNVRQRAARVALLEKCWQGKNQVSSVPGARAASTLRSATTQSPVRKSATKSPLKTPARPESSLASASQPQEPPPSAQPMSPPKRPRGRPRKTAVPTPSLAESVSICAAALAPSTPKRGRPRTSKFAVEIPDSDSDDCELDGVTASTCSVPDETFSPSQGVDLSLSMEEDTELSISISACDKPSSFEYISKAITTAPRSKDVNNPSWHEKILMYDPIVLEDLTAWLNCGPLTKAGYDDEVSSGEVKKWSSATPASNQTSRLFTSPANSVRGAIHLIPSSRHRRQFANAAAPPSETATTSVFKKPAAKMAGDGDIPAPRPSSSVVLLSPSNEILLLHRVKTSTSFASAHVFPGGNVDPFHDGDVPPEGNPDRHRDGLAYRLCAIRETFEESGILLAKKDGQLVQVPEKEREEARKQIHSRKVKFGDWLDSIGAKADTDALIPYTRWITPTNVPKRFTTQMYIYMLPLRSRGVPSKMVIPTADGGIEHTAALFAEPQAWMKQANKGEIILFPPQYFILETIGQHAGGGKMGSLEEESKRFMQQRRKLTRFVNQVPTATTELGKQHPSSQIPWADKVISPVPMYMRDKEGDRRAVLSLNFPGPELEGSDRAGDFERVVLAKFGKKGPTGVEVRLREEILDEDGQPKSGRLEKL